ncbi:MAG TPA: TadE/TadG family type IV pilus assembly protein [Sphingomonas sp.]|nr:TadE/TadG family type IV pilus assembly protein [Sphingomonas sp.]
MRKIETARIPRRRLTALARDRRGATIIEFALVAAPFIALILATIQTSIVFFAQQTLETTAEKTARQLVTDQAQQSGMSQQDFQATACSNLPAFMQCANLMVDVQNADSFDDIDTAAPTLTYDSKGNVTNNWQFNPGPPGSIVVMRTMYLFPVISGPLGLAFANSQGGKRLLVATSVFKSETYTQ